MSTKKKVYSADFKAKLVLEILEGEKTINEIASAYEIIPNNLKNWKKQFVEKDFAVEKLVSLASYKERKSLLDSKHTLSQNK